VPHCDGRDIPLGIQWVEPGDWLPRFMAEYGFRSTKRFMKRFNAQLDG
jgi:hypothetical protein